MTGSIKNVPLETFRSFLLFKGLKHMRTSGGYEIWSGKSLTRPVTIQTHIDPIPLFIIKKNLRTMGLTLKDFRKFLGLKTSKSLSLQISSLSINLNKYKFLTVL